MNNLSKIFVASAGLLGVMEYIIMQFKNAPVYYQEIKE